MKTIYQLFTASLAVTLLFSSCDKKDKVEQKATLNYKITTSNRTSNSITWTSGTGSGKQIAFKGNGTSRVEEYVLTFNSVDFFTPSAAIATAEIPAGTYTNAEFNYQMIPSRNPALQLKGTFNGTSTAPITINLDQFVEIATKLPSFTAEAGKSYTVRLNLDLGQMMNGITTTQLNNATRTNGEIVIAYYSNISLYQTLINNINNVMQHAVEIVQ